MKEPYLEVTFRRGRPLATYYYLPRQADEKSYRTIRVEPGMVIDLGRSGRSIGIEMTARTKLSVAAMNRVLREFGFATLTRADLAPLRAA